MTCRGPVRYVRLDCRIADLLPRTGTCSTQHTLLYIQPETKATTLLTPCGVSYYDLLHTYSVVYIDNLT